MTEPISNSRKTKLVRTQMLFFTIQRMIIQREAVQFAKYSKRIAGSWIDGSQFLSELSYPVPRDI